MGYCIVAWLLFIASYFLEHFSFAIIFQFATTCMFCGRYAGVLFRKKPFIVCEVIGLLITFGWKILRKKLVWHICFGTLAVRGLFILLVLYHMKTFMFITKEIKINKEE